MDYEEKYNEALERASKLRVQNPFDTVSQMMEHVFPELADSEEERIRKRLIQYFSTFRLGTFAGIEPKKIIDWLEKQKEYESTDFDYVWKATDCSELTSALDKYSEDAIKKVCHAWYDKGIELERRNWLEKQGEQILANIEKTCKDEQNTWSEEDEDNFKHLMDEIVCLGNSRNSANRLHYDRLIKFLYELKNRAQPREEWRDKDERMLDRLIAYFEKRVAFTDDDNPRYADWLKSLRPRSQWKPSDEQMDALDSTLQYSQVSHNSFEYLNSLFNDLKKLREE